MKKTLIVAAVAIAVLAFCGCASTSSGTTGISSTATGVSSSATATTTQQTDALLDDDELEDEEDTVDIDYDLAEYTMDGTMNGGYSYEATLKIGPWVKASDTETINEIWEEIGGSGSVPDIDTFTRNNWSSGIHFSEGSSMMAFGTISVTDTTQGGFSIGDSSLNLNISVYSDELGC